ncbi:PIG-L deacetylase family protein [Microvirga aerophila]|nr:PIG-L family deacetylase [Microvirga aerophila]
MIKQPLIKLREWFSIALFNGIIVFCNKTKEDSGRSLLVLAPHYDDETFGCGGLIALMCGQGREVKVVFLTDGSASHNHFKTVSREQLMKTREKEVAHAASILGLKESDLIFLKYQDGSLAEVIEQQPVCVAQRVGAILKAFEPAEVYVTCQWDNHSDHEAAFDILLRSIGEMATVPEVYQYPISAGWRPANLRRFSIHDIIHARVLPIKSALELKRKAIGAYSSQIAVLPKGFTKRFLLPYEIYFKVPKTKLERCGAS